MLIVSGDNVSESAGDKTVIDALIARSHAHIYATAMSPTVTKQVLGALKLIKGDDGTDLGKKKIQQLAFNAKYFRTKLKAMGFIVYGNDASPVIPVMIYCPGKLS